MVMIPAVADPRRLGTPVMEYDVDTGARTDIGTAFLVTTRNQLRREGCPQWLKDVVVADDVHTAVAGALAAGLKDDVLNSCCLDSRDVKVWKAVRSKSAVTLEPVGTFRSLAVNFNLKRPDSTGTKRVQMNELWIATKPFPPALNLSGGDKTKVDEPTEEEDPSSPFTRTIPPDALARANAQCDIEN